jgi:thiol-disulfide isomerase/thioredoxin
MRRVSCLILFSSLVAVDALHAQTADIPAAAQSSFDKGKTFELGGQLTSALDSYRDALKQAGVTCTPCLEAIEHTQLLMGNFHDAVATADKLASTSTDPHEQAHARLLAGQALYREYVEALPTDKDAKTANHDRKHAAEVLRAAEVELAQGVTAEPTDESVRYLHARVLAGLKRDEDASKEFTACANTLGASAAECARTLRLAANAASAREEASPSFAVTTVDDQKVSSDSLLGKIVLLDFWGTWCPYCRRDSDYVQSLLDSFDKKDFALLEVDVDDARDKWKTYIHDERLDGLQTQDEHKKLVGDFRVTGYPTYIILDANGTVRFRISGAQGDLRGEIKKLLAEQAATATTPREKLPTPAKPGQ